MSHTKSACLIALLAASSVWVGDVWSAEVSPGDKLRLGFLSPPASARPRVWWHWMNGNVTAEGARLDLEWMQRVGVGGVHAFSGLAAEPKVVATPQPFMSAGWADTYRTSVRLARDAGMEVGVAGSPGWSQTGGPWVPAADGMKKYVWSEVVLEGGKRYRGALPVPPSVTGPFQGKKGGRSKEAAYGDAAVFAFRTPKLEQASPAPSWTTSAGPIDLSSVTSLQAAQFGAVKLVAPASGQPAWLQASFPSPTTIGAIALGVDNGATVTVQAEQSPGVYRTVARATIDPPMNSFEHAAPQETVAFPPVKSRRFRVLFQPAEVKPRGVLTGPSVAMPPQFELMQVNMVAGARINSFEAKAGFGPTVPAEAAGSPEAPADALIGSATVVDLTSRMGKDGVLDWTPPPGRWTVVRLGWSLTGAVNGPAERQATGLEVDKLDAGSVRRYLAAYLDIYEQALGGALKEKGVTTLLTDSWEAGVQNWTPGLLAEFRQRRGYEAAPFLPVLTGRAVDSSDASERFLFDFRTTLKELLADNHQGVIAEELRTRGMSYYTEAQGDNPRALADGMTLKARADIPTAEYWYRPFATIEGQPSLKADLQEAASAAHVYGKPLAAAEALTVAAQTDPWAFSPAMLKPVVDEIFALGINRLLIHESHLQPLADAKPGLTMGFFGQYFNRNDTWAEMAGPWVTYLSRTAYMLQQGRFVADVAYFYGEEQNLTEQFLERFNTDVPKGYAYDYVNPEALLSLLSVDQGQVVTSSGMRYRVLFMPDQVRRLSVPVLQKIRDMVADGAVLVGKKPVGGLGLQSPDAAVRKLADELWGDGQEQTRQLGEGRVYTSLATALEAERIAPDVVLKGANADAVLTLHRKTDDADIYFVSNQSKAAQSLRARFRVEGKTPEVWRADSGEVELVSYEQVPGGVVADLELAAHDAVFVVFRHPATSPRRISPPAVRTDLASVAGPWGVSFEPGRGAPATATFDRLISWPESTDPGIKYFSGVATYTTQLRAPRKWFNRGHRIELDLGEVREVAEISVNGSPAVTAWRAPYRVDVTNMLKPGDNQIEVKVANLWPNRLIGDKQPGAKTIAFAPINPYRAGSSLLPSGLLGPVQLRVVKQAESE